MKVMNVQLILLKIKKDVKFVMILNIFLMDLVLINVMKDIQ